MNMNNWCLLWFDLTPLLYACDNVNLSIDAGANMNHEDEVSRLHIHHNVISHDRVIE